ncbi:MAG: metal-dependent transcriptional regulator [Promethearchaeota archaeon]|nr:MAG: metal-dependent transcriptional regulator [Candidatus Lokiarchaeota archaeon]
MAKSDKKGLDITELPESYQRYIDIIYDISKKKKGGWVQNKEIADNLGVEPASVSGMLEKLKSNNLIRWEPRKAIRLTEKGKQYAIQLDEIHSLLRIFFKDVLQIKDSRVIESVTHEIEHYITQKVKESLERFLSKYLD